MKTLDQRIAHYESLLLIALDQLDVEGAGVSQIGFWQAKAADLSSILTALKGMRS